MILRILNVALAFGVMVAIVSESAPLWLQTLSWLYVIGLIGMGLFIANAKRIRAWCDKQLSKEKREDKDDSISS